MKKTMLAVLLLMAGFSQTADAGDRLGPNQSLGANQAIKSQDGRFAATFQSDGNFVVYYAKSSTPLWASNTNRSGAAGVVLQSDGNLVIYSGNKAVFASNTGRYPNSSLVMQNDGNLVLYDRTGAARWSSNTYRRAQELIAADNTPKVDMKQLATGAPAPQLSADRLKSMNITQVNQLAAQMGTTSDKLLAQYGLVVVNSGNIVANNSSGIVANNSSGIVANNSSGIVANNSSGLNGNMSVQSVGNKAATTTTSNPAPPSKTSTTRCQGHTAGHDSCSNRMP